MFENYWLKAFGLGKVAKIRCCMTVLFWSRIKKSNGCPNAAMSHVRDIGEEMPKLYKKCKKLHVYARHSDRKHRAKILSGGRPYPKRLNRILVSVSTSASCAGHLQCVAHIIRLCTICLEEKRQWWLPFCFHNGFLCGCLSKTFAIAYRRKKHPLADSSPCTDLNQLPSEHDYVRQTTTAHAMVITACFPI